MFLASERQVRVGMNGAYALDLSAVLAAAAARRADTALVLELFPDLEPYVLYAWRPPS